MFKVAHLHSNYNQDIYQMKKNQTGQGYEMNLFELLYSGLLC